MCTPKCPVSCSRKEVFLQPLRLFQISSSISLALRSSPFLCKQTTNVILECLFVVTFLETSRATTVVRLIRAGLREENNIFKVVGFT